MKPKPPEAGGPVKWEEQPLAWPRAAGQVDRLLAAVKVRERRQRRRRIAVTTGVAALLLVVGLFFHPAHQPAKVGTPVAAGQRYRIMAPEVRTLPDGSVVHLRIGSEITVGFPANAAGLRKVNLTRGEAIFEVAKNEARPFIVVAGGVEFRAVGTAFAIEVGGRAVEMLVTEGRVAIDHRAGDAGARAALATVPAGNRVSVDPQQLAAAPEIIPTTEAEIAQKLAWRVPRIEFNQSPLYEAVELLNRYSGSRVTIASPDIRDIGISGVLRADNVEPMLQMLTANYGIGVIREPDGRLVLQREK